MKEFSEYEKKILKHLLRVDETPGGLTVLGNIIDFELYPNFYIELNSEENCPVRIAKTYIDSISSNYGTSGLNEAVKQLNNKLLFIVKLFQYLEREGQIYLTGEIELNTLGSKFDISETPVGYELDDKETIKLIYHFAKKKIVPVESLKKFIKNDFRTDAEIAQEKKDNNLRRNINWTKYGVLTTLFLGILSNIPKFIELFKDKQPLKVEILNKPLKIETNCCEEATEIREIENNILYDNLYFEFDSTGILPSSTFHLETILQILNSKPNLRIEIIGNCDSIGSKKYNNDLSIKRAESVANELTKKGLSLNRIKIIGKGEDNPISIEQGYYGRWKNRRVELRIK